MKILFVVPRFHTNLSAAVDGLVASGVEVSIVCCRSELIEDHSRIEPLVISWEGASWIAIARLLKDISPDITVLRYSKGVSWKVFWLALLNNMPMLGYQQRPVNSPRSMLRLAYEIVWQGLPIQRFSPVRGLKQNGLRDDRHARYIPLPVPQAAHDVKRTVDASGPLRILCVAKTTQPRKRHMLLLDAVEKLVEQHDCSLTLIGADTKKVSGFSEAKFEQFMDRVQSGPLSSRISLMVNVAPHDMAEHYLNHHVCVLPSDNEPLGTSPLEAMAFGTVPLTSTATGSAGTIELAGDGMIFKAGDVDDLYTRLAAFASDRQQLETLGQQVREFSGDHLAPRRFAEGLLQLISDVKRGRR